MNPEPSDESSTAECRIQALVQLIDVQSVRLQNTRNIEFKVNIALWTAILVGAYSLRDKSALNADRICCFISFALFVVLLHVLWMVAICKSQTRDSNIIEGYRVQLSSLHIPTEHSTDNWSMVVWFFAEILATVLFLGIACAIMWDSPNP